VATNNHALRLVESPAVYYREVVFSEDNSPDSAHSLHNTLSVIGALKPAFASFFISKFSKRGDIVLDPFSLSSGVSLEAALQGRIPYVNSNDNLAVEMIKANLSPADLTEVSLKLQVLNVKRPVAIDSYKGKFSAFYDVDTYRELLNLKEILANKADRITRFIGLLACSLLHGHNNSYFSVYSFPHISLQPEEQEKINFKRAQYPEYRPVVPRLLRKAADVFRDGIPSVMTNVVAHSKVASCDVRNLDFTATGSVQLVITAPPLPGTNMAPRSDEQHSDHQWLRRWFTGIESSSLIPTWSDNLTELWLEYMNECLFELARVVRAGGRAILDLPEIVLNGEQFSTVNSISELVSSQLNRYWDIEGILEEVKSPVKPIVGRQRSDTRDKEMISSLRGTKALVLRRK
jgi:hypothetical protein